MKKEWYVIYTKPKAEDATSQLLTSAGIETLNPKIKVRKHVRRKYVEVVEQLFPCYIFAFFDREKHSHMVRFTRGVKYIVGKEQPLRVHARIIEAIQERLEDGIVRPQAEKFAKGERVMIKEGPFKDFFGIFERNLPGRQRAIILLETLHCALELEPISIKKA